MSRARDPWLCTSIYSLSRWQPGARLRACASDPRHRQSIKAQTQPHRSKEQPQDVAQGAAKPRRRRLAANVPINTTFSGAPVASLCAAQATPPPTPKPHRNAVYRGPARIAAGGGARRCSSVACARAPRTVGACAPADAAERAPRTCRARSVTAWAPRTRKARNVAASARRPGTTAGRCCWKYCTRTSTSASSTSPPASPRTAGAGGRWRRRCRSRSSRWGRRRARCLRRGTATGSTSPPPGLSSAPRCDLFRGRVFRACRREERGFGVHGCHIGLERSSRVAC